MFSNITFQYQTHISLDILSYSDIYDVLDMFKEMNSIGLIINLSL